MTTYGFDIFSSDLPSPLPVDEELDLIRKAQNGDMEAENTIIHHNIRLALLAMKRICKDDDAYQSDRDDILQHGLIGLMKGIRTFSFKEGIKPVTYLYACTVNEIRQWCRKKQTGVLLYSLETPLIGGEDEDTTFMDLIPDESIDIEGPLELEAFRKDFDKCMQKKAFTDNEREIMNKHYGLNGYSPMPQVKVASSHKHGWSRQYVGQVENRCLMKLRRMLSNWK